MMLTTMKIENDAVFELAQAHRMLEKPYSISVRGIICIGG